jgi:SAM-dependent methyltransferase
MVKGIICDSRPPHFYDDDEIFNILQRKFYPPPEYGYDNLSLWKRACTRAISLLSMINDPSEALSTIEVGCGDGLTGLLLSIYGADVTLLDKEDWRDKRVLSLRFYQQDICQGTSLMSSSYNLAYSYNSFEHFTEPQKALKEILRLCKNGAYIFFEFGPLYCSPWGLHIYRTIHIPYVQFIFSEDFIGKKLENLGIIDLGRKRVSPQFVNGWRFNQYEELFSDSDCRILKKSFGNEMHYLDVVINYAKAFRGRNLTLQDLTVDWYSILLQKAGSN